MCLWCRVALCATHNACVPCRPRSLLIVQAEAIQKDHDNLHKKMTAPDRFMTVCEVCGVYIQSTDNEARRRDHIEGKQYLGVCGWEGRHAMATFEPWGIDGGSTGGGALQAVTSCIAHGAGGRIAPLNLPGWLAIREKCKALEEVERQRASSAAPREEGELPSGSGRRERSRSRERRDYDRGRERRYEDSRRDYDRRDRRDYDRRDYDRSRYDRREYPDRRR